jgi:hypothetical protein
MRFWELPMRIYTFLSSGIAASDYETNDETCDETGDETGDVCSSRLCPCMHFPTEFGEPESDCGFIK